MSVILRTMQTPPSPPHARHARGQCQLCSVRGAGTSVAGADMCTRTQAVSLRSSVANASVTGSAAGIYGRLSAGLARRRRRPESAKRWPPRLANPAHCQPADRTTAVCRQTSATLQTVCYVCYLGIWGNPNRKHLKFASGYIRCTDLNF